MHSSCVLEASYYRDDTFFMREYDYAKILEFWNQIFMIMGVFMIFRSIYSLRNYNSLLNLLYYTTINIQRESGRHSKWLYKKSWPWMTMNWDPSFLRIPERPLVTPCWKVRYKQYGIYSSSGISLIYTITIGYDVR